MPNQFEITTSCTFCQDTAPPRFDTELRLPLIKRIQNERPAAFELSIAEPPSCGKMHVFRHNQMVFEAPVSPDFQFPIALTAVNL